MHKNAVISLVVILGILIAIPVISYLSFNKNTVGPKTSSPTSTQNIPEATGTLTIVQRPAPTQNVLDVVYHNSVQSQKVLGFSVDVTVSPAGFSAAGSTIASGPNFSANNFIFPFKKATSTRTGVLFSMAAVRSNPTANISLNDGDVLATITLSNAKSGSYQVAIDNTTSTVLNESNTSLTKPTEGSVTVTL